MKFIFIIILMVMFGLFSNASAQTGWTFFKSKDLPQIGSPGIIHKDWSAGVYLGFTGGLAKFNGEEWIKIYYNLLDPKNGGNEFNVKSIVTIFDNVWTGTSKGLIKFTGFTKKVYDTTNTPSMFNDYINGIANDQNSNIWFLNNNYAIFKLDVSADTVVKYSIPNSTPLPFSFARMFCDGKDNLWYMASGKIVKFNTETVKVIDSNEISDLKNDKLKSIEIKSENYLPVIVVLMEHNIGIYKDDQGSITYNKIDVPTNLLDNDEFFYSVKNDGEGNLWIISRVTFASEHSSKHFYKYSKNKEWTKYEFPVFEGTFENLYPISDFTIDVDGKVWFVSLSTGVFVFDPKVTSVENTENNNCLSLFPNPVKDILSLNSNKIIEKIEIFSVLGIKVYESEYKDKIDVSYLNSGVYFLKTGEKVLKFVKI